jgi:hypothetical protein
MQVMANHSPDNIAEAVRILKTARQRAEEEFAPADQPAKPRHGVAA